MTDATPSLLSNQILKLYRLVGECPAATFQDSALSLVRGAIAFDGFAWGVARTAGRRLEIDSLHASVLTDALYNVWPKYRDRAALTKELLRAPNRSIAWNPKINEPDEEVLELWYRANSVDSLAVSCYQDSPERSTMISVARLGRQSPLRQRDADVLGTLVPHLSSALRLTWFSERYRHAAGAPAACGRACADSDGWIHHLDDAFASVMQLEWPSWQGPRLPLPLRHTMAASKSRYVGQRISLTTSSAGTMWHLEARQRQLRDRLTERERQIADLYASGMRYKEIGRKLQLAPSTVRTRLSTIYLKLDVSTKAGLSSALQGKETSRNGE